MLILIGLTRTPKRFIVIKLLILLCVLNGN